MRKKNIIIIAGSILGVCILVFISTLIIIKVNCSNGKHSYKNGWGRCKYCNYLLGQGIEYKLTTDGYYVVNGIGICEDYNIELLNSIKGIPVKVIKSNAFNNCKNLIRITIPENIEIIEEDAFKGCEKLIEVENKSLSINIEIGSTDNGQIGRYVKNFGESKIKITNGYIIYDSYILGYVGEKNTINTMELTGNYYTIYQYAFYNLKNVENVFLGTNISLIQNYAFYGSNIKNFELNSNNIERINSNCFENCNKLENVVMNTSKLRYVNESCFKNCINLTMVNFSNTNLIEIDKSTFFGCIKLQNIQLPNTVKTLKENCFYGCEMLNYFYIGENITSIEKNVFKNCINLYDIEFNLNGEWYYTTANVAMGGIIINVSDRELNALNLTLNKSNYYWYKN